jgi:hypothetical protein
MPSHADGPAGRARIPLVGPDRREVDHGGREENPPDYPLGAEELLRGRRAHRSDRSTSSARGTRVGANNSPGRPRGGMRPSRRGLVPRLRRKRGRRLLIAIGVVLVIGVVVARLYIAGVFAAPVHVSSVVFSTDDHSCLFGLTVTVSGFSTHAGASVDYSYVMHSYNRTAPCTVEGVSTRTSGFSLSGADTPFTLPPLGFDDLSFTIGVPNHAYDGNLTIGVS